LLAPRPRRRPGALREADGGLDCKKTFSSTIMVVG
jgi:hypothetical protein